MTDDDRTRVVIVDQTLLDIGDRTTMWRPAGPDVEILERTAIWEVPRPDELARGSSPAPMPSPEALRAAPALPGLTPLLEREVFQLARRVALQGDLTSAVRVLRHGLTRLVDSPDATCIFFDAAPSADDQELVARVAATGQRVVIGHALLEPVGSVPARAVLVLRRSAAQAAFGALEVAVVAAVAHAIAGLLGHFLADHAARTAQAERDAKTPFRPEALAERRRASALPGRVVRAPRTWIRWAFPTLLGLVATAIVAAALVEVPTYSSGVGIVTVEGEQITSPMPGTVAQVLVAPNTRVAVGDALVRMRAIEEEAELAAAEADYRSALAVFLASSSDDSARIALATIATRRQRAQAAVDARTLHATTAGIVGDIRVKPGLMLVPGTQVMKIARAAATPVVVAVLPGTDRPRLATGMTVQLELPGYHGKRAEATIDAIDTQIVGPDEARRSLGDPIGDALPIHGPVVIVHAHLMTTTFEADGRQFELHDGMLGKAEVRVSQRSLLSALLGRGDRG